MSFSGPIGGLSLGCLRLQWCSLMAGLSRHSLTSLSFFRAWHDLPPLNWSCRRLLKADHVVYLRISDAVHCSTSAQCSRSIKSQLVFHSKFI